MQLAAITRGLVAGLSLVLLSGQAVQAQSYGGERYDQDDPYYDDRGYDGGNYRDDRYDRDGRNIQTDEGYYDDDRYGDDDGADDVSFFYDELRDHGRWISHRDYGYVWTPANVDDDWRPYSRGYWVNTEDHGWYWVSEEQFGWATYHYGRWFHDDRYGWLWVPGTTWGPAWVAWRNSDSYVGWAPLPPDAHWDRRAGLRYSTALYEEPRFAFYWNFIEPRYISTPGLYRYAAPRHRARTLIYSTRPATRYDWRNDNVFNVGLSISFFNRYLDRPLTSVRVYATDTRNARGYDRRAGNTVRVWRPDIKRRKQTVRHDARPPTPGFWANIDRRGTWQNKSHKGARPVGLPPSGRSVKPPVNIKNVPRDTYTPPRNVRVTPPYTDRKPPPREFDRPAARPDKAKRSPRDNPRVMREPPDKKAGKAAPPAHKERSPPNRTAETPPPKGKKRDELPPPDKKDAPPAAKPPPRPIIIPGRP